ncbi:hypothetical protein N9F45_00705 [Gammaproteobacteria bacterium]|mgnify:FL=1|nr:hypothetical protein [Gammaproteobacteria bacterium]MDB0063383.1 hypothetical protein [Gammaproteobacteria bacterium]
MFNFSKVLPKVANNELDSPKIAVWAFILFTALMTWRSIVHMLFESWGLHGIANFIVLTGDPDPMPVIYRFFSLWGASQVLFCLVCWVVVFKYKSLIPLMNVFWLIDWGLRLFIYPLIRVDVGTIGIYTTDSTPGIDGAPVAFGIIVIVFLLSVANKRNK